MGKAMAFSLKATKSVYQCKRSEPVAEFEQVLLAYVAAWNEADEGKRRALLETSWAEHGTYIDPTAQVAGREALVQHLGRLSQQFPDQRVLLTSGVDTHHGLMRFTWARLGADGRKIRNGIDFGELAADGRPRGRGVPNFNMEGHLLPCWCARLNVVRRERT